MFSRVSIVLIIVFNVATVARAGCKIQPGLFNWWAFDKLGDFVADRAGTNNAGVEQGSPKRLGMPSGGWTNGAMSFLKDGDAMSVPNHPEIDIGVEDFTITGRFSLLNTALRKQITTILDKRSLSGGKYRGYAIFLYGDRFGVQMANGTAGQNGAANFIETSAGNYADGSEHFFVVSVRRAPKGGRVWVDGKLVLTFTPLTGSLLNPGNLRFAAHFQGGSPLLGTLDEVQMYRYFAYAWDDISDADCKCDPRFEMTGWWRFDEGSSPFAFDSAGVPNNAHRPMSQPSCNGRVRGAARFAGGSSLYVNDAPDLNVGTGDFSIIVWIKAPPAIPPNVRRGIVGKGDSTTGFALYIDTKGHLAVRLNATTIVDASGSDIVDDQWHLVVVTVSRTSTSVGTL